MHSIINLSGLTVGLTCYILIAFFIQFQFSFDNQHEKAQRIYRVVQQQKGNLFRGTDYFANSPEPLAPAMVQYFPEVEVATTFSIIRNLLYSESNFFTAAMMYADKHIFDVFTIPILQGDGNTSVEDPDAILISSTLAKKYFGSGDPIGKTLLLNDERPFTVRGVFADMPPNQHFSAEAIISIVHSPFYEKNVGKWASNAYYTYFVLEEGADFRELEKKFSLFDEQIATAYSEFPFQADYKIQPLLDIYLHSDMNAEIGPRGDIRYIYVLGTIGLIILLMASINYTNLATARSARRSGEIGIRKVMGARRKQLVHQMLGESMILTLLSFLAAIILAYFLLPTFSQLVEEDLSFNIVGSGWVFPSLLIIAFSIGILSGFYPALIASHLSPTKAFKGNIKDNFGRGFSLRNVLIVVQFTAAVFLTMSSIVVYKQLEYIRNKKLGFNRDHIVYVPFFDPKLNQEIPKIRQMLMASPKVKEVSVSSNLILNTSNQGIVNHWDGNGGERNLYCYKYFVDEAFLDLYEITLIAGRNFSEEYARDSVQSYILNETAVRAIGWTNEEAIGKTFNDGLIIGVVGDFHFQPMDLRIEPLYMNFRSRSDQAVNAGTIAAKVGSNDLASTISFIKDVFREVAPRTPFVFRFLDEGFELLYSSERRLGKVINIFTAIALFIASMGLFGLVSHQIVLRTREIGIRKVLGATPVNLLALLSRDFLKLVAVATLLAFPAAWYTMQNWLNNFAYHTKISWWILMAVILPILLIAGATVIGQSLKAALTDPVQTIREK